MGKTTAYWEHDTLMVSWYGSEPEATGVWLRGMVSIETNDDEFVKRYSVKPNAASVLSEFLDWQNKF